MARQPTEDYRMWLMRATLAGIVLAGLALRLYGIDWDQGHLLHPDERQILLVADAMRTRAGNGSGILSPDSPLNPGFFAYGSLTFYTLRIATDLVGATASLAPQLSDWQDLTELNQLRLVGRALSAGADAATIVLTYLLGCRLRSRAVGLAAAALVAGAVLHVQLSHFYTADTLLVPLCLASLLLLIRAARGGSVAWPAAAGVAIGLALAVKLSAAPLVVVAVVALEIRHRRDSSEAFRRPAIAAAIGCAVAFVVSQPFAIVDWPAYLRDVLTQAAIVSGGRDTVYTRQFIGRPAILYQAWNLAVFGLGVPLAVAALAGLVAALWRALRRRTDVELILLAWLLAYGASIGIAHAEFLRYTLPIVPILCIYAATLIVPPRSAGIGDRELRMSARSMTRWVVVAVVILATSLYAVAHDSIYSRPHTAIVASRWIYDHVPAGSAIAIEHWDESLPLPLDDEGIYVSAADRSYRVLTMPMYDPDGDGKLQQVSEVLAEADWIVLYSNRLYGVIPRMPERYPLASAYYRLLFREELGFNLAYVSASYPRLLGVTLSDDTVDDAGLATPPALAVAHQGGIWLNLGHADESYTVYDHPTVLVFQKTRRISAAEMRRAILDEASARAAVAR